MKNYIKKCKEDGYCPDVGETECPICFGPFQYLCVDCKTWFKNEADNCPACRERLVCEARMNDAIGRDDIAGAIAAVQQLVAKYSAKSEYRHKLTALEHARKALQDCEQISRLDLQILRQVKKAKNLLDQARSSLGTAGLSEKRLLQRFAARVDDAFEELESVERIKRQMITAIAPAAAAGLGIALLWAIFHLVAIFAANREGTRDPLSTYLWTRNSLCFISAAAFFFLSSRPSWKVPAMLMGLISTVVFGLVLMFTLAINGYHLGMFFIVLATIGLVWVGETGLDPPTDAEKRELRPSPWERVRNTTRGFSQRTTGWLVLACVVLFLAAPTQAIPFRLVTEDESPFGEMLVTQEDPTPNDSISTPNDRTFHPITEVTPSTPKPEPPKVEVE
ncbi:MAG: hypothetical protein IH991_01960, partial [Planctomycetes bacterium]|nr:hypothetical protein [Planctomycetota bacterium]